MKKIVLVLLCSLVLVGCDEKKTEVDKEEKVAEVEKENKESKKSEEKEIKDEVMTVENNADFAKLLEVASTDLDYVIWFADTYKGKVIEFDGSIQDSMNHNGKKTRFNYLIYADDYEENKASTGPSFKFEDINYQSFNFTGEKPEYVTVGLNLRFKAKVDKFNANTGIFFIKPVETLVR
ncbi:MAG: DUF4839 domain-containing protein [Erysipelothrix sp.]